MNTDRFYVDEEYLDFFRDFSRKHGLSSKNINYKDLFIFLASLGYSERLRIPLQSRCSLFRTDTLNSRDECILYAIAIADMEDAEIVKNDKEVSIICEEYANGGLSILKDLNADAFDKRFLGIRRIIENSVKGL